MAPNRGNHPSTLLKPLPTHPRRGRFALHPTYVQNYPLFEPFGMAGRGEGGIGGKGAGDGTPNTSRNPSSKPSQAPPKPTKCLKLRNAGG